MKALMNEQRASENIDQELDTISSIIFWKQGGWKTTIALELAFENWEKRIYSNFSIFKNWKQINKQIEWIHTILNIRFSYTPWVIIIDEAGINANSKDTFNKDNRKLIETLFLARKFNCSFIWISQRFDSIDINARILADIIVEMVKIRRWKLHPTFVAKRQKQKWAKLQLVNTHKIDTISIMKYDKLTYNTLEASRFTNWNEIKIRSDNKTWAIKKVSFKTKKNGF
jgi:hypothetical protein